MHIKDVVINRIFDVTGADVSGIGYSPFSAQINDERVWSIYINGEVEQFDEGRQAIAVLRKKDQMDSICGWIESKTGKIVGFGKQSKSRVWYSGISGVLAMLQGIFYAMGLQGNMRVVAILLVVIVITSGIYIFNRDFWLRRRLIKIWEESEKFYNE